MNGLSSNSAAIFSASSTDVGSASVSRSSPNPVDFTDSSSTEVSNDSSSSRTVTCLFATRGSNWTIRPVMSPVGALGFVSKEMMSDLVPDPNLLFAVIASE